MPSRVEWACRLERLLVVQTTRNIIVLPQSQAQVQGYKVGLQEVRGPGKSMCASFEPTERV